MKPTRSLEEIVHLMDDLNLWKKVSRSNWGLKPQGTPFTYFAAIYPFGQKPVKVTFYLLEGWQTLGDFGLLVHNPSYCLYFSPQELPHYEITLLQDGSVNLFRYDLGYAPVVVEDAARRDLVAKMLWESYGVMLRLETDAALTLRDADRQCVFSRVEGADGAWRDEPLKVVPPKSYSEHYSVKRDDVKKAKDLPLATDWVLEFDFYLNSRIRTREPRSRSVYELAAVDAKTGQKVFLDQTAIIPELGFKGMWEGIPQQLLTHFLELGRVPGEIKVRKERLFRALRVLCLELPFKLSLHDKFDKLFA